MKNVSMYTLSTCPWCHKAKKYFTDQKIPFQYVDYDLQPPQEQERIEEEMKKRGASALVSVGAHWRRRGGRLESR